MLTQAQLVVLKAAITGELDPVFVAARTSGATYAMMEWFNKSSTFIVWRTSVGVDEIMNNGFVWTAVDGLTVGKARIWDWMTRPGSINPSKANVRQGLADCFGATSAMATAITPHLKRFAMRGEKLFVTGAGTDLAPGQLIYEGPITHDEIIMAMAL